MKARVLSIATTFVIGAVAGFFGARTYAESRFRRESLKAALSE